jgi:hypothetical protein
MLGDATSVVDIVDRTAAVLCGRTAFFLRQAALVPELHCEADHGLAAVVEDGGDGGAIDATAHCDGCGGACGHQGDVAMALRKRRGLVEQRRTGKSACATYSSAAAIARRPVGCACWGAGGAAA